MNANRAAKLSVLPVAALDGLMIVAGAQAIVLPPTSTETLITLVGGLLVLSGVTRLAYVWHTRGSDENKLRMLLTGASLVCITAGCYMLLHTFVSLGLVTLVVLTYLLVESLLDFLMGWRLGALVVASWMYFEAISNALLLGIVIALLWSMSPTVSIWAMGILVGMTMLFSGVARLLVSLAPRRPANRFSGIGKPRMDTNERASWYQSDS